MDAQNQDEAQTLTDTVQSYGIGEGAWWCHAGWLEFKLPLLELIAKQNDAIFAFHIFHERKFSTVFFISERTNVVLS